MKTVNFMSYFLDPSKERTWRNQYLPSLALNFANL